MGEFEERERILGWVKRGLGDAEHERRRGRRAGRDGEPGADESASGHKLRLLKTSSHGLR